MSCFSLLFSFLFFLNFLIKRQSNNYPMIFVYFYFYFFKFKREAQFLLLPNNGNMLSPKVSFSLCFECIVYNGLFCYCIHNNKRHCNYCVNKAILKMQPISPNMHIEKLLKAYNPSKLLRSSGDQNNINDS